MNLTNTWTFYDNYLDFTQKQINWIHLIFVLIGIYNKKRKLKSSKDNFLWYLISNLIENQ